MLNAQVWALKTLAAGGASVASACYVQRACAHLKPGSARLSVIAPILLQFSLTPFIFSMQHELLSRAFSCAILLWLANFKASDAQANDHAPILLYTTLYVPYALPARVMLATLAL